MTKRSIFLQTNFNGQLTFCLGTTLNADKKQQKRAAISLVDLLEQFSKGFDLSNKAVRDFLYQCEVLLKQDAGYEAVKCIYFHIAEPDAKSLNLSHPTHPYQRGKPHLNEQFAQLHKILSRPAKGLAIAGASALVLTITAMGLSALPEVGKLGAYAGLGLFALVCVLGVSAMLTYYRTAPVLTREQKEASFKSLAEALGTDFTSSKEKVKAADLDGT